MADEDNVEIIDEDNDEALNTLKDAYDSTNSGDADEESDAKKPISNKAFKSVGSMFTRLENIVWNFISDKPLTPEERQESDEAFTEVAKNHGWALENADYLEAGLVVADHGANRWDTIKLKMNLSKKPKENMQDTKEDFDTLMRKAGYRS